MSVRLLAGFVAALAVGPVVAAATVPATEAELGRALYGNCAACHGADGKGNQAIGAPNLTDKTWLHGFGEEAIMNMVNKGKLNIMPAQENRLSADQIKVVASYVWSLSHQTQTAQAK